MRARRVWLWMDARVSRATARSAARLRQPAPMTPHVALVFLRYVMEYDGPVGRRIATRRAPDGRRPNAAVPLRANEPPDRRTRGPIGTKHRLDRASADNGSIRPRHPQQDHGQPDATRRQSAGPATDPSGRTTQDRDRHRRRAAERNGELDGDLRAAPAGRLLRPAPSGARSRAA